MAEPLWSDYIRHKPLEVLMIHHEPPLIHPSYQANMVTLTTKPYVTPASQRPPKLDRCLVSRSAMCRGGRHGRMGQGHQMSLSAKAMVENQGENNLSKTTKSATKMEKIWRQVGVGQRAKYA